MYLGILDADGDMAGDAMVWRLEFPLMVLFYNREYQP